MEIDYINRNSNMREIKAEMILSLEELPDFLVQTKENSGTFYRNYSPDLIKYDRDNNTITLSRDGIHHLLPEGLFFEENELTNSKNFEKAKTKIKAKKKDISDFFQPFDTKYFRLSLELEKQINKISEKGNEILLDLFFNKTAVVETQCIACLLPQISQIKGNEYLIVNILKTILDTKKIELIKTDYNAKRFIIHIPNLSKEEYFAKTQQISGIFKILEEYFLPFDINYDFKIKDKEQKFILGEDLILDYNTNII